LFVRHLPVAGPLYLIILPPLTLRHNAKVDPAGSCPAASGLGLPPVSTAGHMAVVAAGPRPFLSRVYIIKEGKELKIITVRVDQEDFFQADYAGRILVKPYRF
jgi:hypothetical protein